MVGNAALRIVVGANALGAVASAYLALAVLSGGSTLLLLRLFQNAGTQHAQAFFAVLQLGFFVLALRHNAGGDMRHAHCGLGFINILATSTACAVGIDAQISGVNFYVHFLGLRQHSHSNSGGMNAALGFGFGHALYAMHAAFKLHAAVHSIAVDLENNFLKATQLGGAGVHNLHLPATGFGVAQVHSKKYAGKESGLFTTSAAANFHDNVLVIIGVGGQQKNGQALLVFFDLGLQLLELLLGHFHELFVLVGTHNFFCLVACCAHVAVFAIGSHHGLQLGVGLGGLLPISLVGDYVRVANFRF